MQGGTQLTGEWTWELNPWNQKQDFGGRMDISREINICRLPQESSSCIPAAPPHVQEEGIYRETDVELTNKSNPF